MIYLKQESAQYLYPFVTEAKRMKNGIVNIIHSANTDDILQLRFISESSLGIKFSLEIPNIFSLTMMSQQGNIIVYKYRDAEHYPDKQLLSIDEVNLIRQAKPFRIFHFIFNLFTEAVTDTLLEKQKGEYHNQLEYYSFRTIRFLMLLFIAESNIVASWGINGLKLQKESILFSVQGHHFTGQVQISYNTGADLFDISFLQDNITTGQRTGVYFDELIDYIDRKVEYIEAYQ